MIDDFFFFGGRPRTVQTRPAGRPYVTSVCGRLGQSARPLTFTCSRCFSLKNVLFPSVVLAAEVTCRQPDHRFLKDRRQFGLLGNIVLFSGRSIHTTCWCRCRTVACTVGKHDSACTHSANGSLIKICPEQLETRCSKAPYYINLRASIYH